MRKRTKPGLSPQAGESFPGKYGVQMIRKDGDAAPWNIARATLYGAVIGAVAAAFKLLAPESLVSWGGSHSAAANAEEIVGASLAFALLCGLAAAARNFIVRRLVPPPIK